MVNRRVSDFDEAKTLGLNFIKNGISMLNKAEIEETHKDLTSFETDGCRDVIDREIWNHISEQTQTNIKEVIKKKIRPDGIDIDLWAELSLVDKDDIIQNAHKCGNEFDQPEEIDITTWKKLTPSTRNAIMDKMYTLRPKGFDPSLWDSLNDVTKQHITNDIRSYGRRSISEKKAEYVANTNGWISWGLYRWMTREPYSRERLPQKRFVRWWIQRLTINSRVLTFFFSDAHVIEDPDSGIGAMVLVCALILTIPFSMFSFLNGQYFLNLQTNIDACDGMVSFSNETYGSVHGSITTSLSVCMFFSMMGLIISSIYFVFKPLPGKEMARWCRSQGRWLIASLFFVTSLSIAGLMALGVYFLKYVTVLDHDVCVDSSKPIFVPGIAGLVVAFVVALACMW
jgi:hypothetical protein